MKYENSSISTRVLLEGGLLHPRLEYNEFSIHVPRLREPARFLHVSDTHFGEYGLHSWLPRDKQFELIEHIVDLANDPDEFFDALLFTGDAGTRIREFSGFTSLFTTDKETLKESMEPFNKITIPKIACSGNHDTHSEDAEFIMKNVGFQFLDANQKDPVITNINDQISIWGLPDFETQSDWHDKICQTINQFKNGLNPDIVPLILAHNPDSFGEDFTEDLFFIGFSGHTHAGVYQHELLNSLALAKLGLNNKLYRSGLIRNGNGSVFNVSNGSGRHTVTPGGDIPMGITAIDLLPEHYADSFHLK